MKLLTLAWYVLRSLFLRGPVAGVAILLHEKRGDLKYGINTRGLVLQSADGTKHYQGASYYVLEKLFAAIKLYDLPRSFFDIGCGMGRVLIVAQGKGFLKCTGIDINAELIAAAKKNLSSARCNQQAIEVLTGDASTFNYPKQAQLYFLFNPFDEKVLLKCLQKIEQESSEVNYFLYMNPVHHAVFENLGYQQLTAIKTGFYTEAILYKRSKLGKCIHFSGLAFN